MVLGFGDRPPRWFALTRFRNVPYVFENTQMNAMNDRVGPNSPVASWPDIELIPGASLK
jgi:hypothetical protein